MKRLLIINALGLLVIIAMVAILLPRNTPDATTPTDDETITLRIDPWAPGDFVQPSSIEETCTTKMKLYLRKARDLSREVEDGKELTGCALVESRIGKTQNECGFPVTFDGCSICNIRCY